MTFAKSASRLLQLKASTKNGPGRTSVEDNLSEDLGDFPAQNLFPDMSQGTPKPPQMVVTGNDDYEKEYDAFTLASDHVKLLGRVETHYIRKPRASGLYKVCIRQCCIGSHRKVEFEKSANFKMKITFGIGDAVHYWAQNEDAVFGDRRRGWWKCRACDKIVYFGPPPDSKKKCNHCGALSAAFVYEEHGLETHEEFPMTGHPDMFLAKSSWGTKLRVTEIKTLAGDLFTKLKAPDIEHVWQLSGYMSSCNHSEPRLPVEIDEEVGYILYISKGYMSKTLPMKMFRVERNDKLMGRMKDKLRSYSRGIENYPHQLPPVNEKCDQSDFGCYQSKSCPVKTECMKLAERRL